MLDRLLHHCHVVISPTATATACDKPGTEEAPRSTITRRATKNGNFYLATSGDDELTIDN
jgi:hypothetical protein